jgi:single-strand DNA-binding protein
MRSVNKVMLIGNLTRDVELRHTKEGTAVSSFGLATNRNWTQESGEKREETDFHRIVAWGKLAELCEKYLKKGRKVYVEGRLHSHSWIDDEGLQKAATEIIIDDMVMLDSKSQESQKEEPVEEPDGQTAATAQG